MAKQVITLLTDDLEGGEADSTVEFAIGGIAYTIDLNEKNAEKLHKLLAPFVAAGTRIGRVSSSSSSPGHAVRRTGVDHQNFRENRQLNTAIREWAEKNGYDLADRGRIPQHVVDAYHAGRPNPDRQDHSGPDVVVPEPQVEAPAEPVTQKVTGSPRAKKATPATRRSRTSA